MPRVFDKDINHELKYFDEFGVRMSDDDIKQKEVRPLV